MKSRVPFARVLHRSVLSSALSRCSSQPHCGTDQKPESLGICAPSGEMEMSNLFCPWEKKAWFLVMVLFTSFNLALLHSAPAQVQKNHCNQQSRTSKHAHASPPLLIDFDWCGIMIDIHPSAGARRKTRTTRGKGEIRPKGRNGGTPCFMMPKPSLFCRNPARIENICLL